MQHQLDMLASVCADETPVIHSRCKYCQIWRFSSKSSDH
nr:hypothetical protein [Vibrio parahaemolyticus]